MNIRVSRIHKRILKEDAKNPKKIGGEEKKKRSTVLSIEKLEIERLCRSWISRNKIHYIRLGNFAYTEICYVTTVPRFEYVTSVEYSLHT